MNLRSAETSDLETTYKIKCNALKPYIERIWDWSELRQREIHRANFFASKTKIIEHKKQEIGYIVLKETKTEISIENLLIVPRFQNLGIGKEVMKQIIKKANAEKKTVQLQVFKINTKAQRFYENLGFKKTYENKNHIGMKKDWFL